MSKRKLAVETTKETKKFNAVETANSGALFQDNDSIRDLFSSICWGAWNRISIESKLTEKLSYSLRLDLLKNIAEEAKSYLPLLHLGFIDKNKKTHSYVVIDMDNFDGIISYIEFLQKSINSDYQLNILAGDELKNKIWKLESRLEVLKEKLSNFNINIDEDIEYDELEQDEY